jgi:hypothetical protein
MSHGRTSLLVAFLVTSLLSGAPAAPSADLDLDNPSDGPRIERRVEQRVVSPTEKILEQMRSSVCGTGPIYVGPVDAPILVRPKLNLRCTLTGSQPQPKSLSASDWVRISVTGTEVRPDGFRKPTLIGSTFERAGTAEIAGQWNFRGPQSTTHVTSAHASQLRIVSRTTGEMVAVWTADWRTRQLIPSRVSVPPDSDVYYDVWDDYWPDNSEYLADPARGRVSEDLDPTSIRSER